MVSKSNKFSKNIKTTDIVICLVIFAILSIGLYFLCKDDDTSSERYATGDIPASASKDGSCKIVQLADRSGSIMQAAGPALANADPKVVADFYTAIGNYTAKLAQYNSYPNCSGVCIGGTINSSGYCICPVDNPIPYKHTDNNIYCISNDLSNLSGATVTFDPIKRQFACNSAYYNVSGDNICYNSANKQSVLSALQEVSNALNTVQNSPSKISSIFGQVGNFYISGQASAPTLNSKISNVTGVTSISQAVTSAPANTQVFVYNPQKSMVDYYSDAGVKVSTLATGTLTIGTTTY